MGFHDAFAMASQPPFSSPNQQPVLGVSVVDRGFFLFENEDFLSGTARSLSLGFESTSATGDVFVQKAEHLPFSLFEEPSSKAVSQGLNAGSNGIIDSDEDFGEFESVPAAGFSAKTVVDSTGPEFQMAVSSSEAVQSIKPYDSFHPLLSAVSPSLGTTQQSTFEDDIFGPFSSPFATTTTSPFLVDGFQGASEPGYLAKNTGESDDDWGDFVENSDPANHKMPESYNRFHVHANLGQTVGLSPNNKDRSVSGSLTAGVSTLDENIMNRTFFNQHSANLGSSGTTNMGLDVPIQSSTVHTPDGVAVNGSNSKNFQSFFADFPSNSSLTFHDSSSTNLQAVSGKKASHSRKNSVVENTSGPLPLSLFGEEELETDKHRDDIEEFGLDATRILSGHVRSASSNGKSSLDLHSGDGKFSDFIASLYSNSDGGSIAYSIDNWSNANPNTNAGEEEHSPESNVSLDASDQYTFDAVNWDSKDGQTNNNISDVPKYSLDEQLLNLDLDYCIIINSLLSSPCKEVDDFELPEQSLASMNNTTQFGSSISIIEDCKETGGFDDSDKILSLETTDWNKLLFLLLGEGRVKEAVACVDHLAGLDHLSTLQKAYTAAVELLEQGKADAIAMEMEVAKLKLAKAAEVRQWNKRSQNLTLAASSMILDSTSSCEIINGLKVAKSLTIEDMLHALGRSSLDVRALVFEAEFPPEEFLLLAKRDIQAAVKFHSRAVSTFWVLACASVQDQHLFLNAWQVMASACASELEHALSLWRQAQDAKVHFDLLANPQGMHYFAAVGQLHAVSLIVATSATLYKPWLAVAVDDGKALRASLQRCKSAWVKTGLKDAVRLALHAKGSMPSSMASWKDIECLARTVQNVAKQAAEICDADRQSHPTCGLSLLPVLAFSSIRYLEWNGQCYLLPLANLWANRVSHEPPQLPSVKLGSILTS